MASFFFIRWLVLLYNCIDSASTLPPVHQLSNRCSTPEGSSSSERFSKGHTTRSIRLQNTSNTQQFGVYTNIKYWLASYICSAPKYLSIWKIYKTTQARNHHPLGTFCDGCQALVLHYLSWLESINFVASQSYNSWLPRRNSPTVPEIRPPGNNQILLKHQTWVTVSDFLSDRNE